MRSVDGVRRASLCAETFTRDTQDTKMNGLPVSQTVRELQIAAFVTPVVEFDYVSGVITATCVGIFCGLCCGFSCCMFVRLL